MKYRLLFMLIVMTLNGFAQTTTNGFWEIPFYSSVSSVKSKVLALKKVRPSAVTARRLLYKNVTFAGESGTVVAFDFFNDKMFKGSVLYSFSSAVAAVKHYETWRTRLLEKYGTPKSETHELPLYARNEDEKLVTGAFKSGDANFTCLWLTTDETTKKGVVVSLMITRELTIIYAITDMEMFMENSEKDDSQASKDY